MKKRYTTTKGGGAVFISYIPLKVPKSIRTGIDHENLTLKKFRIYESSNCTRNLGSGAAEVRAGSVRLHYHYFCVSDQRLSEQE